MAVRRTLSRGFVLWGCAFIGILACSAAHATNAAPQHKLDQTLKNLQESRGKQADTAKQLARVEHEFSALQQEAARIAKELQESESRVSREEEALSVTSRKLSAKQKEFALRRAEYASTIALLLRMRELPASTLFAKDDKLAQLMRTARVLEKTNRAVAQKALLLRRDLEQLGRLKQEAGTRGKRTEKELKELKKRQESLAKTLSAREKLQQQLRANHAAATAQVERLSRESESLQALIGKLEEEAKKSPAPVKKPPTSTAAATQGKWKLPVQGEILHRFGEARNGGDSYRGIEMKARTGATVVAPADGEVVFTGPFRDYGTMVLIKHATRHITLIAGLGKTSATLGQQVIRGEPVGAMPATASPIAYLELRDATAKPIDPAGWFANVTSAASKP